MYLSHGGDSKEILAGERRRAEDVFKGDIQMGAIEDKAVRDTLDNQKFSLEDLMPEDTKIKVGEKEYELRKINLEDEVWIKKYGNLQDLINKEDVEFMASVVFRQMKDKSDFMPMMEETFDEEGEKITKKVTGPMRLMRGLSGPKQKYEMVQSICACFGISRPIFDKMVEEALKKNEKVLENPPSMETPGMISDESSMKLPASTESRA